MNRTKSASSPIAAINKTEPYRSNFIGGGINLLKIDNVKKANHNTSASLTTGETKDGKKSPSNKRQQQQAASTKTLSPAPQRSVKPLAAKQVPFGSGSRRPLGAASLQEIYQYTYIPDVRAMNALNASKIKEQRQPNLNQFRNKNLRMQHKVWHQPSFSSSSLPTEKSQNIRYSSIGNNGHQNRGPLFPSTMSKDSISLLPPLKENNNVQHKLEGNGQENTADHHYYGLLPQQKQMPQQQSNHHRQNRKQQYHHHKSQDLDLSKSNRVIQTETNNAQSASTEMIHVPSQADSKQEVLKKLIDTLADDGHVYEYELGMLTTTSQEQKKVPIIVQASRHSNVQSGFNSSVEWKQSKGSLATPPNDQLFAKLQSEDNEDNSSLGSIPLCKGLEEEEKGKENQILGKQGQSIQQMSRASLHSLEKPSIFNKLKKDTSKNMTQTNMGEKNTDRSSVRKQKKQKSVHDDLIKSPKKKQSPEKSNNKTRKTSKKPYPQPHMKKQRYELRLETRNSKEQQFSTQNAEESTSQQIQDSEHKSQMIKILPSSPMKNIDSHKLQILANEYFDNLTGEKPIVDTPSQISAGAAGNQNKSINYGEAFLPQLVGQSISNANSFKSLPKDGKAQENDDTRDEINDEVIADQQQQQPLMPERDLSQSNKLVASKILFQKHQEFDQKEHAELLTIISAQKQLLSLDPKEVYTTQPSQISKNNTNNRIDKKDTTHQHLILPTSTRSKSNVGIKKKGATGSNNLSDEGLSERLMASDGEYKNHPTVIPRRILQQQVTNERIYSKSILVVKDTPNNGNSAANHASIIVNQNPKYMHHGRSQYINSRKKNGGASYYKSQSSLAKLKQLKEVKLDSQQQQVVQEIIPRLSQFPLQGKTIQVAGHDDSQIFASKKVKDRNNTVESETGSKSPTGKIWKTQQRVTNRKSALTGTTIDIRKVSGQQNVALDVEKFSPIIGPAIIYKEAKKVNTQQQKIKIILQESSGAIKQDHEKAQSLQQQYPIDYEQFKVLQEYKEANFVQKETDEDYRKSHFTQQLQTMNSRDSFAAPLEGDEYQAVNQHKIDLQKKNVDQKNLTQAKSEITFNSSLKHGANSSKGDGMNLSAIDYHKQIVLPAILYDVQSKSPIVKRNFVTKTVDPKAIQSATFIAQQKQQKFISNNKRRLSNNLNKTSIPSASSGSVSRLKKNQSHKMIILGGGTAMDLSNRDIDVVMSQSELSINEVPFQYNHQQTAAFAREEILEPSNDEQQAPQAPLKNQQLPIVKIPVQVYEKQEDVVVKQQPLTITTAKPIKNEQFITIQDRKKQQQKYGDQGIGNSDKISDLMIANSGKSKVEQLFDDSQQDFELFQQTNKEQKPIPQSKDPLLQNQNQIVDAGHVDGINIIKNKGNNYGNSLESSVKLGSTIFQLQDLSPMMPATVLRSNANSNNGGGDEDGLSPFINRFSTEKLSPGTINTSASPQMKPQPFLQHQGFNQNGASDFMYLRLEQQLSELKVAQPINNENILQKSFSSLKMPDNNTSSSILQSQDADSIRMMMKPMMTAAKQDQNVSHPSIQVDPISKGGLKLILEINRPDIGNNQQQSVEISQPTTSQTINQMKEQVDLLRNEREMKSSSSQQKLAKIKTPVQSTEARFKHSDAVLSVQQARPGPGSYDTIISKNIRSGTSGTVSFGTTSQVGALAQHKKGLESATLHVKHHMQQQKTDNMHNFTSAPILIINNTADQQQTATHNSNQAKQGGIKSKGLIKGRPYASIQSKGVPSRPMINSQHAQKSNEVDNKLITNHKNSDFTGSVDFYDVERNTIAGGQNKLSLRTVQRMFAGRQEQHTLNVQQLVRINKLNQLNQGHQDLSNRDLQIEEQKGVEQQQNIVNKNKKHIEIQQNQSPSIKSEVNDQVGDSQYHHNHNLSSSNQNSIYQLASMLSLKEKDLEDFPFLSNTNDYPVSTRVEPVQNNGSSTVNQQESTSNDNNSMKIQQDASVALIILEQDAIKSGRTPNKINQSDVKGIVSNESDLLKILLQQRSNQQAEKQELESKINQDNERQKITEEKVLDQNKS